MAIAKAERYRVSAIAHVLSAVLRVLPCGGKTEASSSAANRSDGLPYHLDRAEDRGDHDHDRRGEAYGENVIQHGRPELAINPSSVSGAGAHE